MRETVAAVLGLPAALWCGRALMKRGRCRTHRFDFGTIVRFQAQPIKDRADGGLVCVADYAVGDLLRQFQQRHRGLRCIAFSSHIHFHSPRF